MDRYLSLLADYGCRNDGAGGGEQEILVDGQRIGLWHVPSEITPDEDLLMARTDVARLSGEPSAALYQRLLQANAFWSGIHGGALGLRGNDVLMLSVSQRLASLDVAALDALLQHMAEDARRWQAWLQEQSAPAQALPPGSRV